MKNVLRLVAWEVTNRCNLHCKHCRAADAGAPAPNELSTTEALDLVRQIAELGPLTLILSGGEPLIRQDIMEIVRSAVAYDLRVAVATNGTLLDAATTRALKNEGVRRVSLSLDGADAAAHDGLRGLDGAFDLLMNATSYLKKSGLPFQINTTVMKNNVDALPEIVEMVPKLGAVEHHIFMFVPTGRGFKNADMSLGADRYEEVLRWIANAQQDSSIRIQVTCAPHYYRIQKECTPGKVSALHKSSGCLAGTGFAFISSEGEVFPCGFLPVSAGDIHTQPFATIWRESPLFISLRDRNRLEGRCGICKYKWACGGCRARAYAVSGNLFGEEPYCKYQPGLKRKERSPEIESDG